MTRGNKLNLSIRKILSVGLRGAYRHRLKLVTAITATNEANKESRNTPNQNLNINPSAEYPGSYRFGCKPQERVRGFREYDKST
jgi:hypothetical protein